MEVQTQAHISATTPTAPPPYSAAQTQPVVSTPMGNISRHQPTTVLQKLRQYAGETRKAISERAASIANNFTYGVKAVATEIYNTAQRTIYGTGIGFIAGGFCSAAACIGLGALFGANPVFGSLAIGMSIGMMGVGATTGGVVGAAYPLIKQGVSQAIRMKNIDLELEKENLAFQLQEQRRMMASFLQSDQVQVYRNVPPPESCYS